MIDCDTCGGAPEGFPNNDGHHIWCDDENEVPSKRQVEIMEHALGNETHYRNYYALYENSDNYELIEELVEHDLMYLSNGMPGMNTMMYFSVTEKGKDYCFK